jgi:5-methylcytosine-specific restriction endonuclease McrA
MANWRNRDALMRNAEGTHTAQDVKSIYDGQGGDCVYCGADLSEGYHVDHIMPLVLGGSNWPNNLQCLCPTCNLRKGGKHPEDWHKEIGFK